MSEITTLTGLQYNNRDVIESVINDSFITDYGIVKKVNSDKTIDVTHSAMPQLISGVNLPVTETRNVEVIFPASASFGQSWPIAVGDGVLLIGLKDYVHTTKGIQAPTAPPNEFIHYVQDSIKAIPLQSVASPKVTINVSTGGDLEIRNDNVGGLLQLKNSSKSLFTVLNNLITHISSLTTTNCVVGSPVVLNPATIAQLTSDAADLALLLKA